MPPWLSPVSLHDALPIYLAAVERVAARVLILARGRVVREGATAVLLRDRVLEIVLDAPPRVPPPGFRVTAFGLETDLGDRTVRSEEHTSELQSLTNLVCRPGSPLFPYTTLFRSISPRWSGSPRGC